MRRGCRSARIWVRLVQQDEYCRTFGNTSTFYRPQLLRPATSLHVGTVAVAPRPLSGQQHKGNTYGHRHREMVQL